MFRIKLLSIVFVVLSSPSLVVAGVDLPWSTTYNCPDWLQYSDPLSCDGLAKGGSWKPSGGDYEKIYSSANNANGDGSKGQRHWIGEGTNSNSGGTTLRFNTPQTNFWMRWYMRWEKGFTNNWGSYKTLYFYSSGGTSSGGFQIGYPGTSGMRFWAGGNEAARCQSCGYGVAFYPSGVSDGGWHEFQIHVDTRNSVAQVWIDGNLIIDNHSATWGSLSNVESILIGSNTKDVSNGKVMYIDYDDIAVVNSGYISSLPGGGSGGGSTDQTAPAVSVTSPSVGQTVSGTIALSASASDNVGVAGVQFRVDGADYGSEDTSAPYSVILDTAGLADGGHTVAAVARDAAGNQATSSSVDMTVSNTTSGGGSSGGSGGTTTGTVLFSEGFEDANLSSRGWYDNTSLQVTSAEHVSGSTSALEFNYTQGSTTPTTGGAIRKKFTETDRVYISYYVKYSSNWQGSNQSYHPHEFYLLTNKSGDWSNLAYTPLTAYIEQNEGEPLISIQDSVNIDTSNINNDLTSTTENRAVAGCNGDSDGYGNGTCYPSGSDYQNGKAWRAGANYFQDSSGAYYKNDWHFVEAFIQLNSITNGKANNDGVIKYWYDGQVVLDHSDVVLRTGANADMNFNQFVIAPYIGNGSPTDQSFWVDNLTLGTGAPSGSEDPQEISTPQGFNIVSN